MTGSVGSRAAEGAEVSPRVPGAGVAWPVLPAKVRPPSAESLVRRPRLLALMDEALTAQVVVVSAPAGSGKTSAVAAWVAERDRPIAWLSLDSRDREPRRMWNGVLAALSEIDAEVTVRAHALLAADAALRDVVTTVLADIEHRAIDEWVLVLDDVHIVDDLPELAASLEDLATYLPRRMRLVMIGRRKPPVHIERMQATGMLRELRFEDLRFSPGESRSVLRRLAPDIDSRALEATVDGAAGWAASLVLNGLAARAAARRSRDPGATDGLRLTDDYLWFEALADESVDTLAVLGAASMVDRINGELACAMTARADAKALLDRAADRGLFLTRLAQPGWYAPHSLVRALVSRELHDRDPCESYQMHARAAAWFEECGDTAEAVRHWHSANLPERGMRAIAQHARAAYGHGAELDPFPIELVPQQVSAMDAATAIDYAWMHVFVDRRVVLDVVELLASRGEEAAGSDETALVPWLTVQAVAATARGAWAEAGTHAEAALAELAPHDRAGDDSGLVWTLRARAIALTERWSDDALEVRLARRALCVDEASAASFAALRALGLVLRGRVSEAMSSLDVVDDRDGAASREQARGERALAGALALSETGANAVAIPALEALAEVPLEALPHVPFLAALELALCHARGGDAEDAERWHDSACAQMAHQFDGEDARGRALRVEVQVALAGGDLARAEQAAAQVTHPVWGPLSVAEVLAARGARVDAADALAQVVPQTEREQVVLDSMMARVVPTEAQALELVRRAARDGAAYGMVRAVLGDRPGDASLHSRLECVADEVPVPWLEAVRRATALGPGSLLPPEAATLTARERDVLRMLPSRLTVDEIARELCLSKNTVKFHLKVIYRKLGCSSRAEAALVARRVARLPARPARA